MFRQTNENIMQKMLWLDPSCPKEPGCEGKSAVRKGGGRGEVSHGQRGPLDKAEYPLVVVDKKGCQRQRDFFLKKNICANVSTVFIF